jgi:hypothetical protein
LYSPCFIGFVDPSIFDDDEESYQEKYVDVAAKHIGSFYGKLSEKKLNIEKTALLLLPFSSLDILVDEFIAHMGIDE